MQNCKSCALFFSEIVVFTLRTDTDIVGDKICIFGFSRGAYTARALAGMLHKVHGILHVHFLSSIHGAWVPTRLASSPRAITSKSLLRIKC